MNNSNPSIRCPLPPIGADPDSLRQFEGSTTPKFRVLPLPPQTGSVTVIKSGGGASSSAASGSGGSGGSGGAGGGGATGGVVQTVSTVIVSLAGNTAVLVPVTLSRSFQILSISANQPCCVRLYGSATARTADAGRGVDAPAPAETTQGLIIDVVFDTAPFVWQCQNIVGANGDPTQSPTAYMTIINPGNAGLSGATVFISFVPLEA